MTMIRRDPMPYHAGWEHFDWTQMQAQRVIPQMERQQPAVGNALIDALGKLLFFGVEAQADEADVVVSPFNDPVGRDAVVQWLGGVNMQLYWDTTLPSYPALKTIPENRVYVSPERPDSFTRSFLEFSHSKVLSDDPRAPGIEIGRASDTIRHIRITSRFGLLTVFVTDGHLAYPYGREMTGYEVANLGETLKNAKAAGATVLVEPYSFGDRRAAMVQFPGGNIAEIHSIERK
jgi:hypothetical protein